jgi:hypothetical protein
MEENKKMQKLFIQRYINSIETEDGCNKAWLKYSRHITCECGTKVLIYNYISHCYTKKHLRIMNDWL